MNYKIIEHTADLSIKVSGKSIDELFLNASIAVSDLLEGKKSQKHESNLSQLIKREL